MYTLVIDVEEDTCMCVCMRLCAGGVEVGEEGDRTVVCGISCW
jgi:hypothetical protein